jgi:hypothetical protein
VAAACAGPAFDFLRFDFGGVVFAAMAHPKNGGSGALSLPDPDASPSRFAPDLPSHHGIGPAVKA